MIEMKNTSMYYNNAINQPTYILAKSQRILTDINFPSTFSSFNFSNKEIVDFKLRDIHLHVTHLCLARNNLTSAKFILHFPNIIMLDIRGNNIINFSCNINNLEKL